MKTTMEFFSHFIGKSDLSSRDGRRRRTLNMMLIACLLCAIIMLIALAILKMNHFHFVGESPLFVGTVFFIFSILIIAVIGRFVSSFVASLLFTLLMTTGILLGDTPREFIIGQSIVFLILPVTMAGLLLRPWVGYFMVVIIGIGEAIGSNIYGNGVPNISALLLFFMLAWLVQHSTSDLEHAVEHEQEKTKALQQSEKAVSEQNQRIQEISQKLVEVQEQERHMLAAELHDDLGQSLTSLKLTLEMIRRAPSSTARQEKITEAGEMVAELMNKVRALSLELRPAMLDDFGLFAALRWWFDLFQSRTGISVHCNADLGRKDRFRPEVETAAFRIIQEALTNVARHASVWDAQVKLATEGGLIIEVADQGAGFNVDQVTRKEADSFGLSGMQERIRLLGGSLEIVSAPGAGTRVVARMPC